jgi:hypothetical protein
MAGNPYAFPVAPPPIANIGAAAAAAPLEFADAQTKIAQDKAAQAQAAATAVTAPMAADDAMLARIIPALTQNPMLANSPQIHTVLDPILKRRGLTLPMAVGGGLDVNALQSLISLPEQWGVGKFDALGVKQWLEQPKEARAALRGKLLGAPEWFFTSDPKIPMTSTTVQQQLAGITKEANLLFDAKSGLTPDAFRQHVKATADILRAGNAPGDAAALENEYLNPDGSLNDAFTERHIGEVAGAEIGKLNAIGVHLQNEDAYREEREKDLRDQFKQKLKFDYAKLQSQEKVAYANAQRANRRLEISEQNLRDRETSMDRAAQRFQAAQNDKDRQFQLSIYRAQVDKADGELRNLQTELTSTGAEVDKMSQNAALRKSPLYQALVDKAATLQKTIETDGPLLKAMQADAKRGIAHLYTQVTGNTATVPGATTGTYPVDASGRPIKPDPNDPTGWIHFDGTPVQ